MLRARQASARRSRNRAKSVRISIICEAGEGAASPSLNLRKLVAEGTVDAHLITVLRLVVSRSLLLVSVSKDHELDRFLLEKQKQELSAKKRKRGSADDSICLLFGDFVVVRGENGTENLCRFLKSMPPLQAR